MYYRIPDEEAKKDGDNKIIHRWKLFVKVVEGNSNMIRIVTLDLGKYLGVFVRTQPNGNNEFVVKMDSWGGIKQRPRIITIEFTTGLKRVYEHTLLQVQEIETEKTHNFTHVFQIVFEHVFHTTIKGL